MSAVQRTRTRSCLFNALPPELKATIVKHIYTGCDPWDDRDSPNIHVRDLLPLGATCHEWHGFILPYVFSDLDLGVLSNESVTTFVEVLAPKYGHFCRSLRLFWNIWRNDSYDDELSSESDALVGFHKKIHPDVWLATRNTLLISAIHLLPNVKHLKLHLSRHHWNRELRYCNHPCQCLTEFDSFVKSIAQYNLLSLYVYFGDISESSNRCDKLVAAAIQNTGRTIKKVVLIRPNRGDYGFHLVKTLHVLHTLPELRDLRLIHVCMYVHLAALEWKCPLKNMEVFAVEGKEDMDMDESVIGDISLALHGLPSTLCQLTVASCIKGNKVSIPFPSHLTNLQTLHVRMPLDRIALTYFLPCCANNICLTPVHGDYDEWDCTNDLLRVLDSRQNFAEMKTLVVDLRDEPLFLFEEEEHDYHPARAPLTLACEKRGVHISFREIGVSDGGQDGTL